jgi:CRISPR-associated protein Cas1
MAWRGLHLTQAARLTLEDQQLVVAREAGEVRVALEDIGWMVIDTPMVSLTGALIAACMEAGIAIVTTDARHMPAGLLLPFHRHHRQAGVAAAQVAASGPLKKRLWQRIVQAKIGNQGAHLALRRGDASPLPEMAKLVGSGDPENVEARAAREYWKRLFPGFVREDEGDYRNGLLNYGYAVVRAVVARALVAAGLVPCIGLHHESAANAFNLADDVVEPFRPVVDAVAFELSEGGARREGRVSVADRQRLAGLPLRDVMLGKERMTLLAASEAVAASLVRALEAGNATVLRLPRFAGGA